MKIPQDSLLTFLLFSFLFLFSMADATWRLDSSHGFSESGGWRLRRQWPELVGMTGGAALSKIKQDIPGAQVIVLSANQFMTMDFNPSRIRIFVDSFGKVIRPPTFG